MNKILKQLGKYVQKQKTGISNDFAKFYVQIALRQDLTKKAYRYRKEIADAYVHYTDKYYNIILYLNQDFKLKFIKYTDSNTNLKEELGFKKEFDKVIKMNLVNRVKFLDKFNLTKISKKWYLVNIIFKYYIDALKKLEEKAKTEEYKDINFQEEYDLFKNNEILIEDFSHFTKDKDGS